MDREQRDVCKLGARHSSPFAHVDAKVLSIGVVWSCGSRSTGPHLRVQLGTESMISERQVWRKRGLLAENR
jgi:hypothetical protein